MSYKVEVIERKYLIVQFEASKSSINDLFSDLLNETKGFMYQITVKVLLKKYKSNGEIDHRFKLENSFQETLYMIDVWINNGSGWIVEAMSLNTLTFQLIDHYQQVLAWTSLLN